MQYMGLVNRYAVNRTLVKEERDRRLDRRNRFDGEPVYQLGIVRLNSSYIELVDKYFAWKGLASTVALVSAAMVLWMISDIFFVSLSVPGRLGEDWPYLVAFLVMGTPVLAGAGWLLYKDSFAYTHYPIRLNRKTRMVYVFRLDGTVLSVPWDEVFFCIASLPQGDWEIQAHVLDPDGVTVKETFALSYYTSTSGLPVLERYWEFVRRYMEEGPEDAAGRVEIFMPVADRKETVANGFHRMHAEFGDNAIMVLLGAALALILVPGRWLAMRTSKIPVWPSEIEEVCRVEPNDPYARDATTLP